MELYRLARAARDVIDEACREAAAAGHGRLTTAHVVLALLARPTAARVVLARQGLDPERLRACAAELYVGPEAHEANDVERESGECREAFAEALDLAESYGAFEVCPAHLFLAATGAETWSAYRALAELGVDVERARREVDALVRDEQMDALPPA